MVSQHGILLAVGLISDHFGPLVAKVCECLLRHGALQLPEIARRLKLPRNDLKNSLFVLIQHNCVQAFSYPRPRGPGRRAVTLYLAIFDNILHRLRFSKFLSVIRADIPESEVLIEGLLQNGRLTFDQLVERTISKVPEGTTRPEREEIRLNFNKLLYARYVERCPKPEPSFDPDEQTTPARRRVQKTVEEVLSLEQKIVNTATLSDPERFSELPYSTEDASNANDCPRNAVSAAKRKHGAFEVDEERNSTSAEHEVLWRTNFEKFIFCLKKKFCADRKKPNLKVGTHPIWESFFEANLTNKDTKSVTSSMNGILERLGQKEAGAEMTLDQITRVLEDLQCTISTDDPEAFTFDLRKMVEACRNEEIESLVKKKYGQEAFTIFRLLVTQGCPVETDQIIDTTILDKQIVHSTLYKLWKDDYVDTEKIASAPGTGYAQFFVWKVKNTFREQFIDNLYHTALNLRQMVEYIRELLLKTVEEVLSLEQKIVNTATLSDPERFSELPYSTEDASNANDCPRNAVSAAKRKHGAFEVDEERNSTSAEHEVLWRTNFEKFIFCLKKKFCADRKKPNLKVGTHPIWESFFEANLTNKDTNSVTSSMNGILERLGQKEAGAEMTLDQITRVLEDLQCNISTDDPEAFTFDLRKMVEACRNEEIESLVKKKYGQEAFTIFRLLVTQGCPVETDQIIDTTILDKQIVHSTLYKLWKDDYVDTEKIASAPGTGYAQFFVWKVKNTFREQFIDNLYHTALNLRQMEYIRELLLKGGSEDKIKGLRTRRNILILALARHDDSLMFHDF